MIPIPLLVLVFIFAFNALRCASDDGCTLWGTTIHLTGAGDEATVRGLTLRLVDYDVPRKSASVWLSSRRRVEHAHQGDYFGDSSKAVRLEHVGDDGIDVYLEGPL